MPTRKLITVLLFGVLAAGCRPCDGLVGWQSSEPPVVPIRNMYDQPRLNAQSPAAFWADGRSMRPHLEGTVAREMEPDLSIQTGRTDNDADWLTTIPDEVVTRGGGLERLAQRGHERYDIYCGPCHAASGRGDGMVARRAVTLQQQNLAAAFIPSNLNDERLRHIPDGQLYATITNGIRTMPAYRQSIPLDDRWAIVAYVRALQLSQLNQPGGAPTGANREQNP